MTSTSPGVGTRAGASRLSRADALRAYFELGPEAVAGPARVLGWTWVEPKSEAEPEPESSRAEVPTVPVQGRDISPAKEPIPPLTFWRPVSREYPDPEKLGKVEQEEEVIELVRPTDVRSSGPPPETPPIVPEARLRRCLDEALKTPRASHEIDVDALVEQIARGESLGAFPHRTGLTQARLVLVLDPSPRLIPFWDDLLHLALALHRRLGSSRIRRLPPPTAGARASAAFLDFAPDEVVLALSDLGFYGSAEDRQRWVRYGRRLRAAGATLCALVPCPAWRWKGPGARLWRAIDWSLPEGPGQRQRPAPLRGVPVGDPAEALLRLLAPAVRVEPGLLRVVRRLLGAAADLGTEADVWNHEAVDGSSSRSLEIDAKRRLDLDHFTPDGGWNPTLVAQVARAILDWHAPRADLVWASEVSHFRACGLSAEALGMDRVAKAERVLDRASRSLVASGPATDRSSRALAAFWSREIARTPAALKDDPGFRTILERVIRWQRKFDPQAPLPAGMTPGMIEDPPLDLPIQRLGIWQWDDRLRIGLREAGNPGSLLVELTARGPRLTFGDGRSAATEVRLDGKAVEIEGPPQEGVMEIVTDQEAIRLETWTLPTWASSAGRDGFGLWAAFEVAGVEQRMRWIPPGRFLMGSPEEEEGRDEDEGPRHLAVLTEGFWLAEAPCAQELWQAVMGENPSRFKSSDRPVEQVSWEDCQLFIDQLNFSIRDLELDLPSETEWEYACRAGTETGTWRGDLEILGLNNAPMLDEIAWYGGNSGRAFDLKDGFDTSDFSEKQYEDSVAGTRKLGQKPPNSWGLQDMLGNVFEWCWDWWGDYSASVEADSEGPGGGSLRVIRGGSWYSDARDVRAAYRLGYSPGSRNFGVGFRLSRGPQVRGAAGPARGSAFLSGARRRRTRAWVERLGWAVDGGVDEYGRWATLEVKGVIHRLRWIYPGRFLMGSPESEQGHYEYEGPQHEVTLTKGFWLGQVPCTQALWQAVMGKNPSRFPSPNRPVEQVSWEDCQEFFERLQELVPAFPGRLPTEAQWEYACRAGTTVATWVGDLQILGERNAPRLDQLGWYGGNSGVDFDLENGYDSSEWGEKQYAHTLAGTREVGLKSPNPWGLYDMLGNVFEWCEDSWDVQAKYSGDSRVDPVGTAGSYRVIRGGSWFSYARFVRAAYRGGISPGYRHFDVGFRLSRGPQEPVRAEPAEDSSWAEPRGEGGAEGRGEKS